MNSQEKDEIKNKVCSKRWKERNLEYINALQKFFDTADNIKDEELKMEIIYKMLKCDEVLTKIAEETFINKYKK